MALAELASLLLLMATAARVDAGTESITYKQIRCKTVGSQTTAFSCVISPTGNPCPVASGTGTCDCSSQDITQGSDSNFMAERDVEPHCYVFTYQLTYTSAGSGSTTTYQILKRSFSNETCLSICDSIQSLPTLNYFRCYTFEGSNYDDVTNAGTSSNVVCKTDWSGTPAGIAVITILSILGFLLLVALIVGLVVLIFCAVKGCKKGNSGAGSCSAVAPQSAGEKTNEAMNEVQVD